MKKYIRAMLDDLRRRTPSKRSRITKLPPTPPPEGLDNQELSSDPLQRTRQLDHQAQKSQERQRLT
jgi:hypothetical protein